MATISPAFAPISRARSVTEHIYDSPTGKYLLIPEGSKLIGVYDSQVSFGRQPGAGTQGFAGLEDEVDMSAARISRRASMQSPSSAPTGSCLERG